MRDLADELKKWQERELAIRKADCERRGNKCDECDLEGCILNKKGVKYVQENK
jgi:hypothetical protein